MKGECKDPHAAAAGFLNAEQPPRAVRRGIYILAVVAQEVCTDVTIRHHYQAADATSRTFSPEAIFMLSSWTGQPFASRVLLRRTTISRPKLSSITAHNLRVRREASAMFSSDCLW